MKQVLPSEPCQVMGWKSLPKPGDVAIQVKNEVYYFKKMMDNFHCIISKF